jgi:hypothetical protein
MAPAIAHFLIGATLLLGFGLPVILRYEISLVDAIWLIPVGGIWGVLPDLHNIAPVFAETLYAAHNTAWMDLCGFHYTLDRPAIRARYDASVFWSIVIFSFGIAGFWGSSRFTRPRVLATQPIDRLVVMCLTTTISTVLATIALGVSVSVQNGFPAVAGLLGSSRVLIGGLVVGAVGIAMGPLFAGGVEAAIRREWIETWASAALVGGGLGVSAWLGGVVIGVPLISDSPIPVIHFGALGGLGVYGIVGGVYYWLLRTQF